MLFSIILVILVIFFIIESGKTDNGLVLVLMMFFLLPAIFIIYSLILFIINKKWKGIIAIFVLIFCIFLGHYIYENTESKKRKMQYEKYLEDKKINNTL